MMLKFMEQLVSLRNGGEILACLELPGVALRTRALLGW